MKITDSAKKQILKNAQYLLILVDVGGCKGFVYEFSYANSLNNFFLLNDYVITDEYSLPFLLNSELDFIMEIGYENFIVNNQLLKSCGCGSSFFK
ncbi:iron-sulfur cluster assembly accessory protein [Alphaproteobacteria bacterium endosymbiont of Tiliacea citrago]|uniref:HesB/IscA family protein n=1 Tax=Alphaproteobacteria bacterium endosymbiont of Tiliacea citrago TaxID=3077944 RepID=UPI00313E1DFA